MTERDDWKSHCIVSYLDEPPFFSPVEGADPIGCDIELVNMVLADLGVADVEFVLTTFAELIDGVRENRWHINTPIFITPERRKLVTYSRPVWAANDGFIVRSDDRRDFSSYEAIAADDTIRLAAVTGQIQLDAALVAGVPSSRISEFADQDAAADAVIAGEVDASVSTAPGNFAYVQRRGDARLTQFADCLANQRGDVALGAFSFNHDATALVDAFDGGLGRILGTQQHIDMMGRYGFTRDALQPALAAANIAGQADRGPAPQL